MTGLKRAAILGGGVIGGGWLARLVENGVEVAVYDPDPEAPRKLGEVLENAERAYGKLITAPPPAKGDWRMAGSVADAVAGAGLIVEAVPERLELKRRVYAELEAANTEGIVASSTSGFKPSDLQAEMASPGRLIVAHPFNPVYLLPLVEVVGGEATDPAVIPRAMEIYRFLGMHPLHLKKEIDAFVADRFLEAVWREALWLVKDGIATTAEIDDAIRFGFGLRWAHIGLFETYRIAGGEAGMRHFLAQFGPALKWPWTKLMDVPELTEDFVDEIARQSDAQSGRYDFRELERIRDDNLIGILHALKANDWAAGRTLAGYEAQLFEAAGTPAEPDISQPIETVARRVPAEWTDYNGHMNESRYGQVFSDAADSLMRMVGCDQAYIDAGNSYFTVEIHIRFLEEAKAGEAVRCLTQVLEGRGKKMRLFHRLYHADGRLLATGDQMLIHVSLETRRACEPVGEVSGKLGAIAQAHAALPVPEETARAVGQRG